MAFVSQPRDGLKASGPQSGSVAIVLTKLAAALGRQIDPVAIAPAMKGQLPFETTTDGLAIHRIPPGSRDIEKLLELLDPRPEPRLLRDAYYRSYYHRAAELLPSLRPDVIHVMTSAPAGKLFRRLMPDTPLVLHLHDELLTAVDPREAADHLAPFSAVVTCSRWLAGALQAHVPTHAGRIWAIGNGIDPPAGDVVQQRQAGRPVRRIVMVGRVSPEKGPHVLLDAFARLAPSHPDLQLDMVGPVGYLPLGAAKLLSRNAPAMREAVRDYYGTGARAFISQVAKPGKVLRQRLLAPIPAQLHDRITLTGPLPHNQLDAVYRSADLLVQPSVCREGYGLPVAEAMAAALPVIASNHGGMLDLVEHGVTGLLVPPGDGKALADAIGTMIERPDLAHAYGVEGFERATRTMTWQVAADLLAGVYARTCR